MCVNEDLFPIGFLIQYYASHMLLLNQSPLQETFSTVVWYGKKYAKVTSKYGNVTQQVPLLCPPLKIDLIMLNMPYAM